MMVSGQRQDQPPPDYFPLKLDQGGAGDPKRYAFLVSGTEGKRISAQTQILGVFLKHKAKIVSHWGYQNEAGHEFVMCLNCDMEFADITPDGLVLELRLLKSVQNTRSIQMKTRLFDGFFFPLTFLDNRALVLDSQLTFLIEHQLKTSELKQVLVEVGRIYVLDIVRQIREKLPHGTTESVLRENVLDYFMAAGFGRFSVLENDERSAQVIIRDPPLSERGEASGNHFIHGIVVGLIESFQGREVSVVEDLYDAKTARLFIALLDKKNLQSEGNPIGQTKSRALQEVDKVISSIEGTEKSQIPALAVNSSVTLNQVLKTYENEGWVGGKIGYVPEPKESHQIVVKYYDEPVTGERTSDSHPPVQIKQAHSIAAVPEAVKPVEKISSELPTEKPRKKYDMKDEELASALKSALREDDDYFEQSDYLE